MAELSEPTSPTEQELNQIETHEEDQGQEQPKEIPDEGRWVFLVCFFGIGMIEYFFTSYILSYGMALVNFVAIDVFTFTDGLWAAIIFIATYNLTSPWSRFMCEKLQSNRKYKITIITSVIILSVGLLFSCLLKNPIAFIIIYGIFGGVCSNIMSVTAKFFTDEIFKNHPKSYRVCRSFFGFLAIFSAPILMVKLLYWYGSYESLLVFGALQLNIIPTCYFMYILLIKKKVPKTQSHQSLAIISPNESSSPKEYDYVAIAIIQKPGEYSDNVVPSSSNSGGSDDCNSFKTDRLTVLQKELARNQKIEENTYLPMTGYVEMKSPLTVSSEKTTIGETSERKMYENSLVTIQDIPHAGSFEPMEIQDAGEGTRRVSYLYPEYVSGRMQELWRHTKEICLNNFIVPLIKSIRDFHFYPLVISKVIMDVNPTIIFAIVPYSTIMNIDDDSKIRIAFYMAYIAIAAIYLYFILSLLQKIPGFKGLMTLVFGIIISTLGIVYSSLPDSSTTIILSYFLFALGYAWMKYSENYVYAHFVGEKKWKEIEGVVETFAALLIILFYAVTYFLDLQLNTFIILAINCYIIGLLIWIDIPLIKVIINYCK